MGLEWLDLYVFLFDHYLVMTKPIPLDMFIVDSGSDNIQPNKSTFFPNLGSALESRKRTNSMGQNSPAVPLVAVTDLEAPENLLSTLFHNSSYRS